MTSSLYSYGQGSLMLSAVASDSARQDLTSLRNVLLQSSNVLEIDGGTLLATEYANFLSSADAATSLHRGAFSIFSIKSHFIYLLFQILRTRFANT